jgi:hypothetical protein
MHLFGLPTGERFLKASTHALSYAGAPTCISQPKRREIVLMSAVVGDGFGPCGDPACGCLVGTQFEGGFCHDMLPMDNANTRTRAEALKP